MASKCVHKGCGKLFTDENEPCVYHPGPPLFHEGQKGWQCCKPRVLTFDEFLSIPPCTTGKHSTIDDTPAPKPKKPAAEADVTAPKPVSNGSLRAANSAAPRVPTPSQSKPPASPAPPESESDDPTTPVPPSVTCKRRGCGATSGAGASSADSLESEKCVYHPGQALFHEGAKGWTCCKKRVLEFDEFMRIPGCKTRDRHCFVGKKKGKRKEDGSGGDADYEKLATVRHDFYQTATVVNASMYLKKIDKEKSKIAFSQSGEELELDLRTQDGKAYEANVPLYARVDPTKSSFKVLGTKLELTLVKAEPVGWPVLRSDEKNTGEIIQTGRAGVA